MPSTFFGLGIAGSGMSTYNAWLNTTAHNISNVKTKGYSKQVVNQSAKEPISFKTSYGMVGAGVDVTGIESLRDVYFDNKYRLSNSDYGKYSTSSAYLQDMEVYLYAKDAEAGSITNSMDNLFKAITGLTEDASNPTLRTNVIGYAGMLTDYIREAATNLRTLQTEINNKIANVTDQINAYAEEIASLNQQIKTLEVYGTTANDLRDKRATIIDDLSQLVDVNVIEKVPEEGAGTAQFLVYIDGAVLVDTNEFNTLNYVVRDTYSNMNDAENLYELVWSNGMKFGIHDTDLGGELQALFDLRDGNNSEVFEGVITSGNDNTLTVKATNDFGKNLFKLEIPAADGFVEIAHKKYAYNSFTYTYDETTGESTYTFDLKESLAKEYTKDDEQKVSVGEAVGFRGIPYYMAQLDEFVRTFSFNFNEVQMGGYDLYDKNGIQMFIGQDTSSGNAMNFDQVTVRDGIAYDGKGQPYETDDDRGYTFSSIPGSPNADGYIVTSYYRMTALNTSIDNKIKKDPSLLACSDEQYGGVENGEQLKKMSQLDADPNMFRQGQASNFLQIMISTLGVDSRKARENEENALNIRNAVETRRLSKSGVDEDEEAQNLVICQNLLTYQYKVLSVMNEVLNKLINDTAV